MSTCSILSTITEQALKIFAGVAINVRFRDCLNNFTTASESLEGRTQRMNTPPSIDRNRITAAVG
jgi:hypothetical protein